MEPEEKRSYNSLSSLKMQSCGVSFKSRDNPKLKKDQSDFSQELKEKRKCISPELEKEESNISCLLVATIGSTDDSIINDIINRIPKDKDIHTDNVEELLAKEALQYKETMAQSKAVNEINTGNNNGLDQTPDDPNSNFIFNPKFKMGQTIFSQELKKKRKCGVSFKSRVNPKLKKGQSDSSQELKKKRKCIFPVSEEKENNIRPEEKRSYNSLSSLKMQSCGVSFKSRDNPKLKEDQSDSSQEY